MRKKVFLIVFILTNLSLLLVLSCDKFKNKKGDFVFKNPFTSDSIPFDSTAIDPFFKKHPLLIGYQSDVVALYKKHQYNHLWHDKNGINEFGGLLYNKINSIQDEGVTSPVPYKKQLDSIYEIPEEAQKPNITTELLNSALYFYYVDKVYRGLDTLKTKKMEWFLPRDKPTYIHYLDSLLTDPSLINKDEKKLFGQYYLLKKALKKYRKIEKAGGWGTIKLDSATAIIRKGDSSRTIIQLRNRLFVTGELEKNSKSPVYDSELVKAVLKFKKANGYATNSTLKLPHIETLNVPVGKRIKTIMVNMERCRWISKSITDAKDYIAVNIPAYELNYFKNSKPFFHSNVVVGKVLNKTVIFSANMQYIVFSPYWNVPRSIIKTEILPEIEKDSHYLEKHNMEWNEGRVRQKPGPKNSLGLVKFLFPNSNNIYFHDTPSKYLFDRHDRAFSHGCIRVEKPKELAEALLKDDPGWTIEKIEEAMNAKEEKWYRLKTKIPVYIGYFTAWVDTNGVLHFYDDIYTRDQQLASLLFDK